MTQEEFQQALCNKTEFSSASEILPSVYERITMLHDEKKRPRRILTGFKEIDNQFSGLHNSDLIVIGARHASGKTTLLLDIARSVAKRGLRVGIFSPEMEGEMVITRIIAADTKIPFRKLRTGRLEEKQHAKFKSSQKEIGKMKLFIDDTPRLTVSEIRSRALKLQEDNGLDLLLVDSAQLIEPSAILGTEPVEHMTEIARGLKLIAQELKIPVMVTAVPFRKFYGEHHLLKLSDFCELARSADVLLSIIPWDWNNVDFREMKNGKSVTVCIQKNYGKTGTVDLWFDSESVSFTEEDKGRKNKQK
jgi:replicative DNA helicase